MSKTKKDQLVEEFHVQVYSSGRIDWDNLDVFLPKKAVARDRFTTDLKRRVLYKAFHGQSLAA